MDGTNFAVWLAQATEVTGNAAVTIAIFTMISALGVALINSGFSWLQTRYGQGKATTSRAQKLVAKQAEAHERFIMLLGYDPRKIKTGYEEPEEVRRGTRTPGPN